MAGPYLPPMFTRGSEGLGSLFREIEKTFDELSGVLSEVCREEQYRELPTTRYGMPVVEKQRKIQPADAVTPTRAVLQALVEGADYPSGEDGRLAVAALVAGHLSVERGNVAVRIDDQLPTARSFPWA